MRLIIPNISNARPLAELIFHELDTGYWIILLKSLKHLSCKTSQSHLNASEDHITSRNDTPPHSNSTLLTPPPQPPPGKIYSPRIPRGNHSSSPSHFPLIPLLQSPSRQRSLMLPLVSPSRRNRERSYDKMGVGKNMKNLMNMMGLRTGVTVRKVSVWYIFLARQLHPDKHDSEVKVMTTEEAVELFKLLNNQNNFYVIT